MSSYGSASLNDRSWVSARAYFFTLPAFGCAQVQSTVNISSKRVLSLEKPDFAAGYNRMFVINGPEELTNRYGRVLFASDRPTRALCQVGASPGSVYPGTIWGPLNDSCKLFPGIPGFRMFDNMDVDDNPSNVYLVQRDTSSVTAFCKATSDWWITSSDLVPTVTANPCTDHTGIETYDGSQAWLPAVQIVVGLPRAPAMDPMIRTGDVFQYAPVNNGTRSGVPFYATGPYLDAKLGTVRLWTGSIANIPRGWAIMNGINGTAADLRGRFVVGYDGRTSSLPPHTDAAYSMHATGGAKTHTHANHGTGANFNFTGSTTAVIGNTHDGPDHRPPWYCLAYIERVQ